MSGPGASGDHSARECEPLPFYLHTAPVSKSPFTQKDIHSQIFKPLGRIMLGDPSSQPAHAFHGFAEVDREASGNVHSVVGSFTHRLCHARRPNHSLRAHAAVVQAIAAQAVL